MRVRVSPPAPYYGVILETRKAERCFALAKPRAGVASGLADEPSRHVTESLPRHHRMYGRIVTKLPSGFIPYQQWPEFDALNYVLPHLEALEIKATPRGVRSGRWPIYFEEYVSDAEPTPLSSAGAPPRLVIWRRLTRTDTPPGWWRLGWRASRKEGFTDLEAREDYRASWSESTKRYWRKWLSEKDVSILPISINEFLKEYAKSDLPPWIRENYACMAKRMHVGPKSEYLEIIGPRDLKTNRLLAGMIVVNSPSCRASYYLCGFVAPDAKHRAAMVGLMDHWFDTSKKRGYRFLHLGEFWIPGKPRHWKGFSEFKSKFGLSYIAYPPVLAKPKGSTL